MALTVPGAMTFRGCVLQHVNSIAVAPVYQTACVRRAIPEAKVAAVQAVLDTNGPHNSIDRGGADLTSFKDGRGFRIQFGAAKTEAQINTFLAAVETAVTT